MKIEVLPVAAFSISCIIGVCKISFFLMKINQFQITMLLFMEEIASQNVALYKEKPSPNHLLPKHKGGGGGEWEGMRDKF